MARDVGLLADVHVSVDRAGGADEVDAVLASYREIGIVKALGFTPTQVVAALVAGMVMPALIGCAVGIPAGAALSLPLVMRAAQSLGLSAQPGLSPVASLLALVAILGCVTVAAALPALRAGRMSAVAAIAGGTPRSVRIRRPSRWLRRLRLPRPLTLGAGDAFVRPLRGGLTVLAVLTGVAMIVFAFGLREAITWYLPAAAHIDGDVSISRESTIPDSRVVSVLSGQSQTRDVLAVWHGSLVVPGWPTRSRAWPSGVTRSTSVGRTSSTRAGGWVRRRARCRCRWRY